MPNQVKQRKVAKNRQRAWLHAKTSPATRSQPFPEKLLAFTAPVLITAAEGDGQEKPRFRITAYTGEAMNLNWWQHPVVIDMATMDASVQAIPALYDHVPDADFIVGQCEKWSAANGAVVCEGYFTPTDDLPADRNYCKKVLDRAKAGYKWQASVGANPATVEEVKAGTTVKVNGRDYSGPIFVARGVQLREVSFVVLGGDRRTSAVLARSKIKGSAMSFEEWLVKMGFEDPASLSEVQKANLKEQYLKEYPDEGGNEPPANAEGETPPEEGDDDETPPPANARGRRPSIEARQQARRAEWRRQEAAETARVNDIRRLCAAANNPTMTVGSNTNVDIAAHAIAENWPVNEVRREIELQQLRQGRAQGPAGHVRSHDRECTIQALQGAMILRARGRLDDAAYHTPQAIHLNLPQWMRANINDADRNRIMEAAHRYSDMALVDLCREALRIDGRDAGHNRDEMIRAAFSGSTLTNIFTTNVNAVLLASYMSADDTTREWTQETDVADYKTNERPRVQIGEGLSKQPRGGEADHAKYSDVSESYKIHRYTRQFQIDEMDIVDDSLGALSDIPRRFGEAAAWLRPDLVYALILANPTLAATARALFNSTDGNLDTSAALTAATLKAAISAMMLFTENSRNLNIVPSHILVPPTLNFTARELLQSTGIVIAGTAGSVTERGNVNTLQGLVKPVAEARLENGVVDPDSGTTYSGSASTWYLAAIMAYTIEVAYLRGTGRAPKIRSFMLDKGKFGMGWDVQHSIGVKALDWRGMHKATA